MAKKKSAFNKDTLSTLLGALAGALTAGQGVMDVVGTGGAVAWSQIVLGGLLAGLGYVTNKP